MKQIESYIPELRYFESKHRSSARPMHEDLALVDVQNGYRVLACRGACMRVGESLPTLCALPQEELAFLEQSLASEKCIALLGDGRVCLVFSSLVQETGLALAVPLHAPASSVCRDLRFQDGALLLSPAVAGHSVGATALEDEAWETVREIFFYMHRIFQKDRSPGLWTRSLLIANFVGCRLDGVELPTQELSLANADRARLLALLFGLFLTLRQKDGYLSAACPLPDPAVLPYTYRVSFEPLPDRKASGSAAAADTEVFAFLSHPSFQNCSVRVAQNKLVIEAVLPQKAAEELPLFHDRKDLCYLLRMELGA
ncbi:MAG: hypothetical protein IKA05_00775 [Clostridia bacterium]|nr:hypothetical protein [Clostridia bacterium]